MADELHEITHPKKRAFLAAYAECGVISHAAEAAGVSRRMHWNWLKGDSEYAEAFVEAKKDAADALELGLVF